MRESERDLLAERIVEDSSHAASKIVRKETVFEVSHPFTKILVCLLPQLNSRCIHEEVSAHAVSLLQLLQSIAKMMIMGMFHFWNLRERGTERT